MSCGAIGEGGSVPQALGGVYVDIPVRYCGRWRYCDFRYLGCSIAVYHTKVWL